MSDRRIFAIGDIHGCNAALHILLREIQPTSADGVILLGDVIDRGPDSRGVVETLLELRESVELVLVTGNHEEMLLTALELPATATSWLRWGGAEMLASYGGLLDYVPDHHFEFLGSGTPYFETETHILVHANLEPGVPLDQQSGDWLRWQKLTGWERPHPSGKRVVCGHTEMLHGVPGVRDGWVMLDTAAYRGGYLTALELNTGEIWQAQQTGGFRRGVHIDEL